MEIIWKTQPSMLLARQAIILHLQHNTRFTVVTSIANFWTKEWKDYVGDKIPAFLLLTDAEKIPWKTNRTVNQDMAIEFFFRSLLLHCLGQGLNCVFISGIQMTATKVLGFYIESSFDHKALLKKVSENSWPSSRSRNISHEWVVPFPKLIEQTVEKMRLSPNSNCFKIGPGELQA